MIVKIRSLPYFLEYDMSTGAAKFVYKNGGFINITTSEAVQFELLAKQDDILESLRLIERTVTGNKRYD